MRAGDVVPDSQIGISADAARDSITRQMEEVWDHRARTDIMYWIAHEACISEQLLIDPGTYGARKVCRGLPDFDAAHAAVLETGGGLGRLLRALNDRLAILRGVDSSGEMISRARRWLAAFPRLRVLRKPHSDQRMFSDGTYDLIVSHIAFEHIPNRRSRRRCFSRAFRALGPGGCFRFQTPATTSHWAIPRNRTRLHCGADHCIPGYKWRTGALRQGLVQSGFHVPDMCVSGHETEQTAIEGFAAHVVDPVGCTCQRPEQRRTRAAGQLAGNFGPTGLRHE